MADISFYKYLEAAFRYRLFDPKGSTATLNTKYNYLGYSFPYNRIFYYARRLLPKFYRDEFPDTEEGNLALARKVLEKLEKHQDTELENQFKGISVSRENQLVLQQASTESQAATGTAQAPAGEPAGVAAGGLPFGIPTARSYGSGRGVIKPPSPPQPKPETPKSELVTANKSGVVVEKPETPSKLYIADKSGRVVGEKTIGSEAAKPPAQSKLYVANKSGVITGERNIKLPSRFNFSSFKNLGSRAGIFFKKYSGRIAGGLGQIAKGVGRGIAGPGLTGAYNLLGKAGTGGINAFANLSNQAAGRGALVKGSSKKIALAFLGALFLFVFGAGLLGGITGTTPIGETSPIPIGTDISSCKFTRAGSSLPIKSSILLGWINNTAIATGIPSQILASVAMHENPDFVANADNNHDAIKSNQLCNKGTIFCEKNGQVLHSKTDEDDPCTTDEIVDGAKTAQAVGLMQLLDIYNQGKGDLCSITNNLAIAAAKLKADGITSQPTQDQVNKAINSYYNSCTYGSYSYCNEVWQDIQNCQQTTTPPPPANGDLKQAINDEFGIDFQGSEFTADHLQAAWEVLNQAEQVAPKFFGLLGKGIIVTTHADTSVRVVNTIYFSTRDGSFFMRGSPQQFKVLLIHELGHIIRGDTGGTRAEYYDQQLQSAVDKDGGYLTGYGENPCYGTPNIDEDFAETVTYYVNKGAKEEDLGCGVKSTNGINPLESGLYPAHLDFIQTELGKP